MSDNSRPADPRPGPDQGPLPRPQPHSVLHVVAEHLHALADHTGDQMPLDMLSAGIRAAADSGPTGDRSAARDRLDASEQLAAATLLLGQVLSATDAANEVFESDPDTLARLEAGAADHDEAMLRSLAAAVAEHVSWRIGELDDVGAALVGASMLPVPRRSEVVKTAGGIEPALETALEVLSRVERRFVFSAGPVGVEVLNAEPYPPEESLDPSLVAVHLVEWWGTRYPDAPVRLARSRAEMMFASFTATPPRTETAVREFPGQPVTISVLLLFDWPAAAPAVVTAGSLVEAIRGSYISADHASYSLDTGALVGSDLPAPPGVVERPGQQLLGDYTGPEIARLIAGEIGDRIPEPIRRVAHWLRPWPSIEDRVLVIDDPDTGQRIVAGDKVVLATPWQQ